MVNNMHHETNHLEPLHGLPNMHDSDDANTQALPSAWPNHAEDFHVLNGASSAVSWSAVFAGATIAAALSLILLLLGTGLGLSSISPWAQIGASAKVIGVSAIVWLAITQIIAYAMGGYLAGRLRTKWLNTHTHEVYFRDTAHGFLVWAVASIATAVLLTSVISAIIGSGVQATTTLASGAANMAGDMVVKSNLTSSETYLLEGLFRKDPNADTALINTQNSDTAESGNGKANEGSSPAEVTRILLYSLQLGSLPDADLKYVGNVVSMRTGLNQEAAEQRATDTFKNMQRNMQESEKSAKETADKARKATAYAALWLFVSLLIGAFAASWAATFGGRSRDASK